MIALTSRSWNKGEHLQEWTELFSVLAAIGLAVILSLMWEFEERDLLSRRILINSQIISWIPLLFSLKTWGRTSLWASWLNFKGRFVLCYLQLHVSRLRGRCGEERTHLLKETWVLGTSPAGSCERSMPQITSKEAKAHVYHPLSLMLSAAEKKKAEEKSGLKSNQPCAVKWFHLLLGAQVGTAVRHDPHHYPNPKNCFRGTSW